MDLRPERVHLADYLKLGYIPNTDEISVSEMLEDSSADFCDWSIGSGT